MKHILILVGVIVMGCLVSSSAMAGLGAGISLGYFSPNYGKINDTLVEINEMIEEAIPGVESDLELGGGLAWTIGLDYDINPNWVIKGEYLNFSPETSDSYSYGGEELGYKMEQSVDIKTNLGALILSGIYKFSPDRVFSPYAGVGIGSFPTKVEASIKSKVFIYDSGEWVEIEPLSISGEASSVGFQLLGGVEYKMGEKLSVVGELRYISAKAEGLEMGTEEEGIGIGEESTDIDWSGFSIGLGASYRF